MTCNWTKSVKGQRAMAGLMLGPAVSHHIRGSLTDVTQHILTPQEPFNTQFKHI